MRGRFSDDDLERWPHAGLEEVSRQGGAIASTEHGVDMNTGFLHISLISGFLPDGEIAVIGDRVKRIAGHAQSTLGLTFLGNLALSLWGANAGTKAIFDALNIIYQEQEKSSFLQLTLRSLLFTVAGMVLVLLAMAGVVVVPLALEILGIPVGSGVALLAGTQGRISAFLQRHVRSR